jgi:maltose-binding protein MalE
MDKITICDLEVFYHVGVPNEERAHPQRLLLTVEMAHDLAMAVARDGLAGTIDYPAWVALDVGGWIEAGSTVEPIDFFLDKATTDRYIPTTMEAMTYRGTVYGLPLNYKVITLIYNKKLVPTPPKTSKELVAMAKKLTEAKSGRFGLAYSYSDYYYHAALQNAFGGRVLVVQSRQPASATTRTAMTPTMAQVGFFSTMRRSAPHGEDSRGYGPAASPGRAGAMS